MQKVISGIFLVVLIALTGFCFFIQSPVEIRHIEIVKNNENSCRNYLLSKNAVGLKWLPSTATILSDSAFNYGDCTYKVTGKSTLGLEINIIADKQVFNTHLLILPFENEYIRLQWETAFPLSSNPIKKLKQYFLARKIQQQLNSLSKQLSAFLSNEENIYNCKIEKSKVTDTIVLVTNFTTSQFPSISAIYAIINELNQYLTSHSVSASNPPMLNIKRISENQYKTMLALPINKSIPSSPRFIVQKMQPGNILVTTVVGDYNTISNTMKQMEQYLEDYHLTAPSIPYQSMITDRMTQKDSTKWITKIYFPVY